jgi:DGQHR domain-containing protein
MKTKEIEILKVNQILNVDSTIGIASLKLTDILKFVKYTQRTEIDEENYQREIEIERVKNINNYILENIYNKVNGKNNNVLGLFPSSTILAVETNLDYDNEFEFIEFIDKIQSGDKNIDDVKLSFFDDTSKLLIAEHKNVLIVDGQHRIYALDELLKNANNGETKYNYINNFNKEKRKENLIELSNDSIVNVINDFEFICTFLINFDLYQQSQIFASVNFKQKPVNKSIYYDIFGSVPDLKNNDLNLAHKIVENFKKSADSELESYINMLGRGKGLISQAFLIEAVRPFLKSGIWSIKELDYSKLNSDFIDLTNKNKNDNTYHNEILELEKKLNDIEEELYKSLNSFLKIAFKKWSDYLPYMINEKAFNKDGETKYNHILLKTVGLGSLIKFYEYPYRRVSSESVEAQNRYFEKVLEIAYQNNNDIFSNEKNGGASGLGTRNKVFNELLKPCLKVLEEKGSFSKKEQRVIDSLTK